MKLLIPVNFCCYGNRQSAKMLQLPTDIQLTIHEWDKKDEMENIEIFLISKQTMGVNFWSIELNY